MCFVCDETLFFPFSIDNSLWRRVESESLTEQLLFSIRWCWCCVWLRSEIRDDVRGDVVRCPAFQEKGKSGECCCCCSENKCFPVRPRGEREREATTFSTKENSLLRALINKEQFVVTCLVSERVPHVTTGQHLSSQVIPRATTTTTGWWPE